VTEERLLIVLIFVGRSFDAKRKFYFFFSADRHNFSFREQMKALLVCLVCSLLVHLTSSSSKPNIVLFLVDDLGIGDVPCFGKKKTDFFISHSISFIFPFYSYLGDVRCGYIFSPFSTSCVFGFFNFPFFINLLSLFFS
jgi:hypothetical protein